jgi:hypothetical protein
MQTALVSKRPVSLRGEDGVKMLTNSSLDFKALLKYLRQKAI